MSLDIRMPGVVLLCSEQGSIVQVIHDTLDINGQLSLGRPFPLIVERGSFSKALDFVAELQTQGAAFDWELNVPVAGQVTTLHFAGTRLGNHLLVVGARTNDECLELQKETVKTGTEPANPLRSVLKEQAELTRVRASHDSKLYDEISRLVNELVTMQRELVKKNAELQELNRQKNRFLGMAAHDLRAPLQAVLAYSDFLIDEAAHRLDAEHQDFLSIIRASSDFMLHLVNDLLDVAKIELGTLELNLQPTDLTALVEHNTALNRILAARKQIELRFHPGGELTELMLDPPKIEQVLNNLIGNAVKFSQPHTTISVRLSTLDDRAVISVHDEGPGMPADELETLFQPFLKTGVSSTDSERSSGLGLVIAEKIVAEHGGEITVESQVGKGTTFYVTLPIS